MDRMNSKAKSFRDSVLFLLEVAWASPRSLSCSSDVGDSDGMASLERHSCTGLMDDSPDVICRTDGFSYTLLSHRGDFGEDAMAFLGSLSPLEVDGIGSMDIGIGGVVDMLSASDGVELKALILTQSFYSRRGSLGVPLLLFTVVSVMVDDCIDYLPVASLVNYVKMVNHFLPEVMALVW